MKILFVARVPATAAAFILPLAKKLRDRGNYVEFAYGSGYYQEEMEHQEFPIHILSMEKKSDSPKNFNVINQLTSIIKEGRYDVVHTYSPVIGLYGRFAARKAKTPVVIHSVIGSLLGAGVTLLHRFLFVTTEWATSRMVDLFITLNDEDARSMVKYRLAPAEKVASLKYEYGVDLKKFDPASIDQPQLLKMKRKYRLDDGVPVIGFVGRMIGAKGILDLFDAYQMVRAKGTNVKLLYVGDVISTDKDQASIELLKKRVSESGYTDDVHFVGMQIDVPFYISLMDVVVHPTHHEGFPRIPVEAGAMQKPSICTQVSGAGVAVDEGKTGFIVPIKNPHRMAERIQDLLQNQCLIREMGHAARQRVEDLFDQDKIVDQQVQIYIEFFKSKKGMTKYVGDLEVDASGNHPEACA